MPATPPITEDSGGVGIQLIRSVGIFGLLGGLLSLIVLWDIVVTIYRLFFHPFAKFPGPKLAAVSRLWHTYTVISGRYPYVINELHKKYGPVVRIQPDELSFTDGQAWEDIYGFRAGRPEMSKETPFYRNPASTDSVLSADRVEHARYRKMLSRGFSDNALREQEPMIQQMVEVFIQRLHERAAKGESSDMCNYYNYLTFDVIGELTFGETFGCLDNDSYHPWVKLIFHNIKFIGITQGLANYPMLVTLLMRFIPARLARQFHSHKQMTREKVNRRRESKVDRADFVSNLFKPENHVPEAALMGNSSLLIVAGSETTATLLSGVTFLLCRNPDALNRLKKEIRSTFSSADQITFAEVSKLKYLLAVLNEALRIFPPAPATFPRRVPEGGDFVCGNFLPSGTQAGICIYAMHHSPGNFKDPESFIPERWMGDPIYENDNRQAMKAFSHGPRACLGKNLAYMEMRLALARLLFEFDLEPDNVDENWDHPEVYVTCNKQPLPIRLTPVK